MSIIAVALLAALNGAAPQDQAAPRVETRSEVRIVTRDGEGPGRLDANGDGVVTREEFSAPMGAAFDRLDADHDGRLSNEELAAGHGPGGPGGPDMMIFGGPHGPGGPGGRGGPGGDVRVFAFRHDGPEGGPEGGPPPPGGPGSRQVFVRRPGGPDGPGEMDKDGDGKVSQEEFLTPLREAFAHMDADHDGFLDEGEGPPPPPAR